MLSPATPCTAPLMRDDVASYGESNLSETSALMRFMIHGNLTGIPNCYPTNLCSNQFYVNKQLVASHTVQAGDMYSCALAIACILR